MLTEQEELPRKVEIQVAELIEEQQSPDLNLCEAFIFQFFIGVFGGLHFRMGREKLGFIYLFTFGGFLFGWLLDWFRLVYLVKEYNHKRGKLQNYESASCLTWDLYGIYFVSFLGLHHFYLNRPKWGFLYLFTFGGFLLAWILDFFRIPFLVKGYLERKNFGLWRYSLGDAYTLLLVPPFGFFGAHHVYLEDYLTFILFLFTFGFFGIGVLVDLFRLPCLVKQKNNKLTPLPKPPQEQYEFECTV